MSKPKVVKATEKNLFGDLSNVQISEGYVEAAKMLLEKGEIKLGTFDSKTEIDAPVAVSFYRMYVVWLRANKMDKSANILEAFLDSYAVQMISYKRKSRQEFIQALKALSEKTRQDKQTDLVSRLTGQPEGT